MESGRALIENSATPEEYEFTRGREVKSLICAPLNTKAQKFGLVLIEHKYADAFNGETVRLLDVIGQQVGIALDNARLYQRMQDLANRDGLTGIYNRLYFHERLEKEFKNADKEEYPLSLAIFDIDHFKKINDTFGHMFGDKVLKEIAKLIQGTLRKSDVLARFGGEEFIILFPRTSITEAFEKVEDLRQKIMNMVIKDEDVSVSVTVSFGLSCYPSCSRSEDELLRMSDDALYEAKTSGRNCVMVAKGCTEFF